MKTKKLLSIFLFLLVLNVVFPLSYFKANVSKGDLINISQINFPFKILDSNYKDISDKFSIYNNYLLSNYNGAIYIVKDFENKTKFNKIIDILEVSGDYIYYDLNSTKNITILDENNNQVKFCYLHDLKGKTIQVNYENGGSSSFYIDSDFYICNITPSNRLFIDVENHTKIFILEGKNNANVPENYIRLLPSS